MMRVLAVCFSFLILIACNSGTEPTMAEKASAPSVLPQSEMFMVTGVTGRQGGAVAKALLSNGYRVRGLSRNPQSERAVRMRELGVEMVKGDFNEASSLDTALRDVDGVFLVTNFWEHGYEAEIEQGKNVVDAAIRAKTGHLVFTSVANADTGIGIPHFESKNKIEEYIRSSKLDYTILRPVSFMDNWEYSRDEIIAGKLSRPFSQSTRVQLIAVRDIGRLAALAFSQPGEWKGRTLDIAGEELSMKQIVTLFSIMTASPIEYIQIPWDEFENAEGEEMALMDRWIEAVGYSANINLVRSELADMWTLEEYLENAGW